MPTIPSQRNARELRPDVLRNEIVEYVDQMERIEVGEDRYASALTEFPLVNLDHPEEEWYVMDGVRAPMKGASYSSESPVGTLDMPDKDDVTVQAYKKKYRPDKGAETEFTQTPFSLYMRAAAVLRTEIFLTREQITWRGDEHVHGLTGQFGDEPNEEIPDDHVFDSLTTWSDAVNSTPYTDLLDAAYEVRNNGVFFGQAEPTVYAPPSVLRDVKRSDDMEDRLAGVELRSVTTGDVQRLVDEEIGQIKTVLVYVPRTDADGNYLDENNEEVDHADEAAQDNVLEPYNPATDSVVRNVIIGRPGSGSAYIPWFSERLLERATNAPDPGEISVDTANGFFTQTWNDHDPITPNFKAAQEIGFKIQRGDNWAIIHDI